MRKKMAFKYDYEYYHSFLLNIYKCITSLRAL